VELARRGRNALLATLALVVVVALPAEAGAALTWSRPQAVTEGNSHPEAVHISARGDVLALWRREESDSTFSTHYAWRPPRAHWTDSRQLGATVPPGARIAVALTPRGQATALWADDGKVFAAEANPGGDFSNPQPIGRADSCCATTLDLAVDDSGNALAAWSGEQVPQTGPNEPGGAKIYAATRTPAGEWSEPQLVREGVTGAGPDLAMNSAGAAVIGWADALNLEPYIAYRPPSGRFGPAERVPSKYWGIPIVAIGERGEAVVATASRSHSVNETVNAVMAVRQPLGDWNEPVGFPIANAPSDLFVDPAGTATMFMTDSSDRDQLQAQFVTRSRSGEIQGPNTVAGDRMWGDIATNLRGDTLALLDQPGADLPVELVERSVAQMFGPRRNAPGGVATHARVALNDAGQAAVVLGVGGVFNPRVQLAVREDPTLPVLPFPPTVEVDTLADTGIDENGELRLAVSCSAACKATPNGILAAEGTGQLVAASGSGKRIRAKRRGLVKLRFGSDQARKVRKAIRAGRKPWVSVSVRARGRSPRPVTVSRRIRLR
jgi:hypothetical protein